MHFKNHEYFYLLDYKKRTLDRLETTYIQSFEQAGQTNAKNWEVLHVFHPFIPNKNQNPSKKNTQIQGFRLKPNYLDKHPSA